MFARSTVRSKITMLAVAAGQALAVSAMAQSVNIDIDRNTGSGSGVPSNGFGAAAGQPGVWNSVPTSDSNALWLFGLNGAFNGLTITTDLAGGASSTSGSASADWGKLMWDYADQCCFFQSTQSLTIEGLDEGNYWLYVYAALPGAAGNFNTLSGIDYYGTVISAYFDENPDIFLGGGITSGIVTPNAFVSGVHFYRLPITVEAGQAPLFLSIGGQFIDSDFNVKSAVNGVQLKQFTTDRLYVDLNATGSNTGESWSNAMTSLVEALNVASTWGIGEIWVADGTYLTNGTRAQSFNIPSGVKMYGGFAGNEASLAQRDWAAHPTFLSGAIGTPLFSDNSYHVVDASDTNSSTLVDGFIITSGNADSGANAFDQRGAGIYGENCDAEFRNCTLRFNDAVLEGGAVFLSGDSDADFVNCTFYNNESGVHGGAISINGDTSLIDVANCVFTSNTADQRGGAIYHAGQNLRVVNSLFNSNSAGDFGGAIYAYGFTAPAEYQITNSTFYNNEAGDLTGGLRAFSADGFVRNSIFHLNTDANPASSTELSNIESASAGQPDIRHSWITGLSAYAGNNNVGSAGLPGFADASGPDNIFGNLDDDFRLDQGYPTVDSGNDTFRPIDFFDLDDDNVVAESLPVDLAGNPRRVDDRRTANANPAWLIDMGAYERRECFFDFNGDGFVDDFDFVIFSQAYADFASTVGDFNNDGFTDDTDFVFFTQAYEQFTCE